MYSPEQRCTVGCFDNKPISPTYQRQVNGFRKSLANKWTDAERQYEGQIAKVIADEAHTPYTRERIFYLTDQVAFIADFYFKKFKVAVEIDGRSHYSQRQRERDEWRDKLLLAHAGVSVIRFSNKAVLTDFNGVFGDTIRELGSAERATPSHQKMLRKVFEHCF